MTMVANHFLWIVEARAKKTNFSGSPPEEVIDGGQRAEDHESA